MKPLLSVIIPCYNCEKTIGRLLDSIVENGMNKDELEVVVCDDKSTDNFLDIVKTYENRLTIKYCETTRDFHCPGNTRQAAIPYVEGEWFTFIDNDDMFEPNAFSNVFNIIHTENIKYVLVTNFREYYYDKKMYGRTFIGEDTDTWLHGKYFNKKAILDEFGSYFKEDLFSHEDVYFNSVTLGNLISRNEDYVYKDIYTYKWVSNPESLSRSYFSKKHYYIETYLGDYILAASDPYFDLAEIDKEHYDWYVNQIMMTMLHAYFYYQACVWRLGHDIVVDNIAHLHELKTKIITRLKLNELDIINFIYQNPDRYASVKAKSEIGTCRFVESQSFRDFILNI